MANPDEVGYIVQYTQHLVRDEGCDVWSLDEVYGALLNYTTDFAGEAVWWPDVRGKVFKPSKYVYRRVGFLRTDAVLNPDRDAGGTDITLDTPSDTDQFQRARFQFATAQTDNFLFLFGEGFNPYFAAGELFDAHPDPGDPSNIASLRALDYSVTYARRKGESHGDMFRRLGTWINRRRDANMVEEIWHPAATIGNSSFGVRL